MRGIPGPSPADSEAACSRLARLPQLASARCVALFASLPDEPSTRPLFEALRGREKRCLLPRTTYAGKLAIDISSLVVDEITLVGSRCGPFAPALELLAAGQVDVEPLIEHRFELADGLRAFERAAEPGVLKVLLDIA